MMSKVFIVGLMAAPLSAAVLIAKGATTKLAPAITPDLMLHAPTMCGGSLTILTSKDHGGGWEAETGADCIQGHADASDFVAVCGQGTVHVDDVNGDCSGATIEIKGPGGAP